MVIAKSVALNKLNEERDIFHKVIFIEKKVIL